MSEKKILVIGSSNTDMTVVADYQFQARLFSVENSLWVRAVKVPIRQ